MKSHCTGEEGPPSGSKREKLGPAVGLRLGLLLCLETFVLFVNKGESEEEMTLHLVPNFHPGRQGCHRNSEVALQFQERLMKHLLPEDCRGHLSKQPTETYTLPKDDPILQMGKNQTLGRKEKV